MSYIVYVRLAAIKHKSFRPSSRLVVFYVLLLLWSTQRNLLLNSGPIVLSSLAALQGRSFHPIAPVQIQRRPSHHQRLWLLCFRPLCAIRYCVTNGIHSFKNQKGNNLDNNIKFRILMIKAIDDEL